MITIKDVAAAAGVSIATVSRVVNDYPHVKPQVRERVERTIAELGYSPNRLASSFRTRQTRIVGVLLRQQKTPFSSTLAHAVEAAMFDRGYRVLLCSTNGDPDREAIYIQSMVEMRAEGVIMRPSRSAAQVARSTAKLREAGIAMVFVDMKPRIASASAIVCDNFSGGYEGMRHLLDLGHRRIGIIAGRIAQRDHMAGTGNVGGERVRGICQAAKDLASGVELVFSGEFGEAGLDVGFDEANRILDQRPDLTAIFATTDMLAIGAMQAAYRRGLRVPQDLSILGYDGVMESAITFPVLSTVRQPIHEMGTLAAETLIRHIQKPGHASQQVVLENTILARGSTAAPN